MKFSRERIAVEMHTDCDKNRDGKSFFGASATELRRNAELLFSNRKPMPSKYASVTQTCNDLVKAEKKTVLSVSRVNHRLIVR